MTINGTIATSYSQEVDPTKDHIKINKKLISFKEQFIYIILHKPKGYLCTHNDPAGRPTVFDLLKMHNKKLFTIGRLDFNSSGLVILTNDGHFTQKISHPKSNIQKTYHVKINKILTTKDKERLQKGIILDGILCQAYHIKTLKTLQKNSWISLSIVSGRNHQIKRMLKELKIFVADIQRMKIGSLSFPTLKPGQYIYLQKKDIESRF